MVRRRKRKLCVNDRVNSQARYTGSCDGSILETTWGADDDVMVQSLSGSILIHTPEDGDEGSELIDVGVTGSRCEQIADWPNSPLIDIGAN